MPGTDAQMDVVSDLHWRCYPFHVFEEDVPPLELGNITILYGGTHIASVVQKNRRDAAQASRREHFRSIE